MTRDLRRGLASITPPDEAGAERRAWAVMRNAFAEREPIPSRRGYLRPLMMAAALAAIVAAALSPPGRAVLDDIRDAIAPTRVERAAPAVFSLPAGGQLLVDSTAGAWVVQADGSKRLLAGYRESSWSPHGLYVIAARRNQLAAIDPDAPAGRRVRWTLSRPNVSHPRWGGTLTDTRIAYFTTERGLRSLRVVAGDSKGDHWVAKDFFDVAPAWRPGPGHVLALAHIDGRIRLWSDTRELVATSPRGERPLQLAWSSDGRRLLALGPRRLRIFDRKARVVAIRRMPRGWIATAMASRPGGSAVAVIRRSGRQSEVVVLDHGREHRAFAGTGTFSGVQWSPNGRRLLVALQDADQWIFIPWGRAAGFEAASNIAGEFESDRFPAIGGWCCP